MAHKITLKVKFHSHPYHALFPSHPIFFVLMLLYWIGKRNTTKTLTIQFSRNPSPFAPLLTDKNSQQIEQPKLFAICNGLNLWKSFDVPLVVRQILCAL